VTLIANNDYLGSRRCELLRYEGLIILRTHNLAQEPSQAMGDFRQVGSWCVICLGADRVTRTLFSARSDPQLYVLKCLTNDICAIYYFEREVESSNVISFVANGQTPRGYESSDY
jgi:hypothetical protein